MAGFVAYYRVSTDRQGRSGLGLDAQRQAVAQFVGAGQLAAEFTEIESGKRHNNRPPARRGFGRVQEAPPYFGNRQA